jgi:hypothetical protein
MWGFQATTYVSIAASYEASTTSNNVTLLNSKCTLSTTKSDENMIWLGVVDATSSSTPHTL